jgi:hypothetical protein
MRQHLAQQQSQRHSQQQSQRHSQQHHSQQQHSQQQRHGQQHRETVGAKRAAEEGQQPAAGQGGAPRHKRRKLSKDASSPLPAAAAPAARAAQPAVKAEALAGGEGALGTMVLHTAAPVQVGSTDGGALLAARLESAMAAHQAAKRQMLAAMDAFMTCEAQLLALARAAGLGTDTSVRHERPGGHVSRPHTCM